MNAKKLSKKILGMTILTGSVMAGSMAVLQNASAGAIVVRTAPPSAVVVRTAPPSAVVVRKGPSSASYCAYHPNYKSCYYHGRRYAPPPASYYHTVCHTYPTGYKSCYPMHCVNGHCYKVGNRVY